MEDSVVVHPLEPDGSLELIYREVLIPSFTRDELEPIEDLRTYLRSDPPEALGLYAEGQKGPVGCCIYYPYAEASTLLLGYIAVVERVRSRGVGARLLEEGCAAWYGSEQYDLVVVELDDPRVFPPKNGIDPQRRIDFYSKHNCQLICGPYFQPCVRPGGQRVHDMLLATLGGSTRALHTSPPSVSAEVVARFLKEYFSVEKDFGEFDHGDLQWIMQAYETEPTVPVIPLADYTSWEAPIAPSRRRA
jgi:predicted N-acetyltransferase YhbS